MDNVEKFAKEIVNTKMDGKINKVDNNYSAQGFGELGGDPAERTAERRRPLEPDPGNAGGGKME